MERLRSSSRNGVNGHANSHTNGATGSMTTGFLSFNSHPPKVYITAEDDEFDPVTTQHWKEEDYDVSYHPMGTGGKAYRDLIKSFSLNLRLGESFAIIAYGDAATVCLDIAVKPMPHCVALVCYYPTKIPHPNQNYPTQMQITVHLAERQGLTAGFPVFEYPGVDDGFAEADLDQYDGIAADLAWSRSLTSVRRGFKQTVDLDPFRDAFSNLTLSRKDATGAIAVMSAEPYINNIPTGTGGIGKRALLHFYKDFFIPGSPPSLQMRLISRVSGVDKVVDEMVISFKHTQEVPWMLPGVPPTNRLVQIPIVSIVAFRGGKLVHEHVYWDQASVLVQIGAIDPNYVPKSLSSKGCKKLPLMGVDEAKKVMDIHSIPSNMMIDKW